MSILVVGSIGLDTVKTPVEEHTDLLGGSASYAALGASFFTPVNLVGSSGMISLRANSNFGSRVTSIRAVCNASAERPFAGLANMPGI